MRKTGVYQTLGDLKHFIPYNLPPKYPNLDFNGEIVTLYGEASFALGQLNEMSLRLPDPKRFIKAHVIKEAMLSSSIEGINTTLAEVFNHNFLDTKINKDTQLVLNYIHALDSALEMLQEGLPLVNRVILKTHEVLLSNGESAQATPGNFRKQSVKVGELVPPPSTIISDLMSDLEKFINEPSNLPSLIKAGLAHVHFETIHPFLDGNGRIGRLLIVLMLIDSNLINLPIIYPSYYFKKYHLEYYQKLDQVRTHGDYEGWIIYYLKAIKLSAIDAHSRAKEIEKLEIDLTDLINKDASFIKMRESSSLVLEFLFTKPIASIAEISQKLNKAYNTIHNILKIFIKLDLVIEDLSNKSNKLYKLKPYLFLLEKEY